MMFNTLTPGIQQKDKHTWTNQQLKTAGFYKYVWPFSGH